MNVQTNRGLFGELARAETSAPGGRRELDVPDAELLHYVLYVLY